MSLSINIPDEHYVTFQIRKDDIYPLGFLVPDGTDQGAQKRKANADDWANRSSVKVPARVFKNKPMVGFEIRKSVHYKSRYSSKETWRLIDPRGFELEITNSNMEFIIDHCIIHKGEILSACVWGREGTTNMLLPVDSAEYKSATANTERLNKKASIKDVKLGDHVVFKKGNTARYLGKYYKHRLNIGNEEGKPDNTTIWSPAAKQFVFLEKGKLIVTATVNISEISKSEPITEKEAELLVNQTNAISISKYRYSDSAVMFTNEKVPFDKFKYSFIPYNNHRDIDDDGYYYAVATSKGTNDKFMIYINDVNRYNRNKFDAYVVNPDHLSKGVITYDLIKSSGYYGRSSMVPRKLVVESSFINTSYDLETLMFEYTTQLGNDIKIKI